MTVEEKIERALFEYVGAIDLDGLPLAWMANDFPGVDGSGAQKAKPDTYVEAIHQTNNNTRLFLKGSAPHLRQGFLQFNVYTPLNIGTLTATTIAGSIAEQFPADLALFKEDVKVRIQKAPYATAGEKTEDGVSWLVRVDIYYESLS